MIVKRDTTKGKWLFCSRPFTTALDETVKNDWSVDVLDEGGTRGLSSLPSLRELLEAIQIEGKLERMPLQCEYFHMLAGSETGGEVLLPLGSFSGNQCDSYVFLSSTSQEQSLPRRRLGQNNPTEHLIDEAKSRGLDDRFGRWKA